MLAFCLEPLTFMIWMTRTTFPIPLWRRQETSRDFWRANPLRHLVGGRFLEWSVGDMEDPLPQQHFLVDPAHPRLSYIGCLYRWQLERGGCWLKSGSIMRKWVSQGATRWVSHVHIREDNRGFIRPNVGGPGTTGRDVIVVMIIVRPSDFWHCDCLTFEILRPNTLVTFCHKGLGTPRSWFSWWLKRHLQKDFSTSTLTQPGAIPPMAEMQAMWWCRLLANEVKDTQHRKNMKKNYMKRSMKYIYIYTWISKEWLRFFLTLKHCLDWLDLLLIHFFSVSLGGQDVKLKHAS